jgi:hypothetical protein
VVKAIKDQVDKHLHVMVYGEYIQSAPNLLAKKTIGGATRRALTAVTSSTQARRLMKARSNSPNVSLAELKSFLAESHITEVLMAP